MDLTTLLWIFEVISSILSAGVGLIYWLLSLFMGLGLTYLQSSILIGICFLVGFYLTFVLLKIVTKMMIFALTFGFIAVFFSAAVGFI